MQVRDSSADAAVFDVVVAGGGCVGSTFACAVALRGLRVALIEARELSRQWQQGTVDLRVFAMTRASQCILDALGVWEEIAAAGISPFREMRVWDAGGSGSIHFDSAELGEPALGHIIEQRVIQAALGQRLDTLDAVVRFCPATIGHFDVHEDGVVVHLQDGRVLRASLLVGADGARSQIRTQAGIQVSQQDYEQQAIVAVVETERSHEQTAWQRFLPTGPLAFLPLRDGRSSIVWSTETERAADLVGMDETGFRAALGAAFDHRLGEITDVGERAAFPLQRLHAVRYVGERLALIGDAAHVIHPLAGQGVNLGLLDAAVLAEVLGDARARGRDPASQRCLRRFERWRRGDNQAMLWSMDSFKQLFGNTWMPVRWLRNTGLNLVDRLGPVKHELVRHAMGLGGDLPRLAQCSLSGTEATNTRAG
jgi:2-octaprenylphenol hydroxylase